MESNERYIIGKCNCKIARRIIRSVQRSWQGKLYAEYFWGMQLQIAIDALSGAFRGREKESNVRHIIGKCNYRLLDAL